MAIGFEAIVYYLVLIDVIVGNLAIWFSPNFKRFYKKQKFWNKYLPVTKGWMAWYLILVLWIGYGLYRLGILPY